MNSRDELSEVLYNDDAPPGTGIEITRPPIKGTVTLPTGTNQISYTPGTDVLGNDSFTYRLVNGGRSSKPATVRVSIRSVPGSYSFAPPIAGYFNSVARLSIDIIGVATYDRVFEFWSSASFLNVPRFVTVPALADRIEFAIPIQGSRRTHGDEIFGRFHGQTHSFRVWGVMEPRVTLRFAPTSVWAGQAQVTGVLSAGAGARDIRFKLTSSTPRVVVPNEVFIPAGGGGKVFPLKILEARWPIRFNVTVTGEGGTWVFPGVTKPVRLTLELTRAVVKGGDSGVLKIKLNGVSGALGLPVQISSNSSWASVPETAMVYGSSVYVTIPTFRTKVTRVVTLRVRFNGVEQKIDLRIVP